MAGRVGSWKREGKKKDTSQTYMNHLMQKQTHSSHKGIREQVVQIIDVITLNPRRVR